MEDPNATRKTMTGVVITKSGSYDVLKVQSKPLPIPAKNEVRIHVHASGLNFAEVMARQGLYPEAPPTPCIVGYEGSGVVEAIGPLEATENSPVDSCDLQVGDRVLFLSRFGGHADTVVIPWIQAVKIPDSMSFEEAAATPVTYLTAYQALFRVCNLRAGDSVLIHAAAGGVGTAAIQLARTVPNVTIYGTASSSKHEFLKKLGVDHCIDYRTQDFVQEIRRLTKGRGVHIVLDSIGGKNLKLSYAALRKPGGRLACFGFSTAVGAESANYLRVAFEWVQSPTFDPMVMMGDNSVVGGVNMLKYFDDPSSIIPVIHEVLQMFERGQVKPIVDEVFPFSKAGQAHQKIEQRKNMGKVILVPDAFYNASQTQ